jgi:hypothetical protein
VIGSAPSATHRLAASELGITTTAPVIAVAPFGVPVILKIFPDKTAGSDSGDLSYDVGAADDPRTSAAHINGEYILPPPDGFSDFNFPTSSCNAIGNNNSTYYPVLDDGPFNNTTLIYPSGVVGDKPNLYLDGLRDFEGFNFSTEAGVDNSPVSLQGNVNFDNSLTSNNNDLDSVNAQKKVSSTPLTRSPVTRSAPAVVERVRCRWSTCSSSFNRKADLLRHIETIHVNTSRYYCQVPGCKKAVGGKFRGYSRSDKLKDHMKSSHC